MPQKNSQFKWTMKILNISENYINLIDGKQDGT